MRVMDGHDTKKPKISSSCPLRDDPDERVARMK